MLDIKKMLVTNDFSSLIHSTEEERQESGGNEYIYKQLVHYLHFDFIQEVVKQTFKNDPQILGDINKRVQDKKVDTTRIKVSSNNVDYLISLP